MTTLVRVSGNLGYERLWKRSAAASAPGATLKTECYPIFRSACVTGDKFHIGVQTLNVNDGMGYNLETMSGAITVA